MFSSLLVVMRGVAVCAAAALFCLKVGAQPAKDLRIDGVAVDGAGQIRLRYSADTNFYYILYRGTSVTQVTTAARMALGTGGTAEFTDQSITSTAAFYRLRRVPLNQPLDTDGDGVDDVYELRHPALFNPLDATDTQHNFYSDGQGNLVKYEPLPGTQILSSGDVAALRSVADDGTLTFDPSSSAAASLAIGQVIVAGASPMTPSGLLRVVLDVKEDASGNRVARTAAAPLQLAFRKLSAHAVGNIDPFAAGLGFRAADLRGRGVAVKSSYSPSGGTEKSQTFEIVVFDGDGNLNTTQDQVKIDATLGGGFSFDLDIDVDWGAVMDVPQAVTDCISSLKNVVTGNLPDCSVDALLPELKLTFSVDPNLAAQVTVAGSAVLGFEKDFDIGTIDLPPIPIGPLVFVPSVDIVASVSGKASARFSVGAHATVELQSKATLSSRVGHSVLDPISIKSADAGTDAATVDLFASATAKAGARLNLALYSIAGPYATATAVCQLDANPLSDPCWSLKLALEGELGVRVTSPRLPLLGYVTLLDWHAPPFRPFEKMVASGTCSTSPEGANPPGGGPTAQRLQIPGFVPWAKVLGGPVDGSSVGDVTSFANAFPFLVPSIDGRFVAGGGGALGLLKLDDQNGGALTWSRQILPNVSFARPLKSLAAVPSADAGLVTLYRPGDAAAFVLAKQTQAGAYTLVRSYRLPDDWVAMPSLLVNDAADGFVVAGYCRATGRAWFAHLDSNLGLVRVRALADTDPNALHLVPSVAVRVGADLVLAGDRSLANQAPGESQQMFVIRLDDQENPSWAVSYACPAREGLWPTAGAPSSDGAVTLAGDATGTSFITRIRKDDTLGFITFPELGGGVRDWLVPASVAELPTTGLIVGYSSGVLAGVPPAVALLGLDGAGHVLWANSYALGQGLNTRAFAWPALRITDDGGILVAASAGPEAGATEGGALVAMKVFAKDGYLGPGMPVVASSLAPTDGTHAVNAHSFAPVTQDSTGTESPLDFVP